MVWDKLAKEYDRLWVQKYSLAPTRKAVLAIIKELDSRRCAEKKQKAKNLVDIGCGTGQLLQDINFMKMNLYGLDKSREMIACAKKKVPSATFFCVNILDFTHPIFNPQDPASALFDGGFDLAVCCHSFPYYKNKRQAMDAIASLLNSDGFAIFAQASINNFYDKTVLAVIEKTAEKADYLSRKEFIALAGEKFELLSEFQIREKWFMPSICGFVMRKR